ncbi:IS110 family transposase [Listeria innocua]|uniref:IS110 family transposase n=1 Tax=Listeria innocua TaxID=1642 RepID=UPI00162A1705|nr:IS110 family transposase [Listeria innocua]MBC2238795.1 IS110 family transposase [Listeria innocua]
MDGIIALDVSMSKSYVVAYLEKTLIAEKEIEHTKAGFLELQDIVNAFQEAPKIIFEATGVYSKPVERFCELNSLDYHLLNPLEVKMRTSKLRRHKTDKTDAHQMANAYLGVKAKKPPKTEKAYIDLKILARMYFEIDFDMNIKRSYLHIAIQETFPEIENIQTKMTSALSLELVDRFPHPDYVLQLSKIELKNYILHAFPNIGSKKAEEKALILISKAENSYPSCSADSYLVEKVRSYNSKLKNIVLEKEEILKKLIEIASLLPDFHLIVSIPGIGEKTAALMVAEMGNIHRFKTNKQLNAFVGIDIQRYQSGKYLAKEHINKRGNKQLRKVLYYSIENMLRCQKFYHSHIVDYYYYLRRKEGCPKMHKVAVIACINKLLKCIHSMVINGTLYKY